MIHARGLPVLTEYDGDLSGLHIDPVGDRPISPTRLEAWVACPHGWFMRYVLGLQAVEQPDEQLQITPRDRGTLVHAALDRFHRQVISGELPQPGPEGWSGDHLDALLQAFQVEADQLELEGATGRLAFWRSEQSRQRYELATWLQHDSTLVAARHAQVVASERRFGSGDVPPAIITLPDGTQVPLTGSVDRIDRCSDGSLVVTDHKTGSTAAFRDITELDPTAGGTKLQLPAYAAAAVQFGGDADVPAVIAEYAFFAKGEYQRIASTIGPAAWPKVHEALQHILDGIRSGVFVARPEKSQFRLGFTPCEYCDPDHLGTAERWAQFERKLADPRVRRLLGEHDDPPADGDAADG